MHSAAAAPTCAEVRLLYVYLTHICVSTIKHCTTPKAADRPSARLLPLAECAVHYGVAMELCCNSSL